MFERPHHARLAQALAALDGETLRGLNCLFGGGTAIALLYGEYRESVDLDFLVSDREHYRRLREMLTGPQGLSALTIPGQRLITQAGEIRADQYGIRTRIAVAGTAVKFEIVHEGRIDLDAGNAVHAVCGISTLTPRDMAATKLLANADRWSDDGVFSRDVLDLAMMRPGLPLLRQAIAKAEGAYGQSVRRDLAKAIEQLRQREGWLERCMKAMAMTLPKAVVWQRVRTLRRAIPTSDPTS